MIDTPRPVEDVVVELLRDGLFIEAGGLITLHGLDRQEMFALAFPNLAKGENRE